MATPQITTGTDKAPRLPAATALLALSFAHDPVMAYLLQGVRPAARRGAYLPAFFGALLAAAALNGARVAEADGWRACGVLVPPGRRVDNVWTLVPAGLLGVAWRIGVGGCMRMFTEFGPLVDAAKAKALAGRTRYFYIFFLGTHPEARGQGLCSALVREYQALAAKEGVPLWLEATTAYSMKLYERLGFKVVEEMVLGKGKAGPDGLECKGGEGVAIWGMIWEPEEEKEATVQ